MRNNMNRNVVTRRSMLVAFLLFALVGAASLAAKNPRELTGPPNPQPNTAPDGTQAVKITATAPAVADGPIRLKITARAKGYPSRETEVDFLGANGTVTGLSATSERKTFKFERASSGAAGFSCPRSKVKECDSLGMKNGGKLSACACLPPDRKSSPPATDTADPAAAVMSYDVALNDGSTLRATASGGPTCWVNKKLEMSICY